MIDLKAGQGKVDIEASVKSKNEPRTFNKYGKDMKVASAVISDDSGEMTLSLWNDDADKVKVGDKVKITNGYVSEFNGQKQLTSGKFGKLEVVNAGIGGEAKADDKHVKKVKAIPTEEVEF